MTLCPHHRDCYRGARHRRAFGNHDNRRHVFTQIAHQCPDCISLNRKDRP